MSYNDISDYQSLIFNVIKFLEEQESSKIKVSFFKGNNFCFWGVKNTHVWVSDTYSVSKNGVFEALQELEDRLGLDLQDFIGLVEFKPHFNLDYDLEA